MNKHIFVVIFMTCFVLCVSAQTEPEADKLLTELVAQKGNVGVSAAYMIDGKLKWKNSVGFACEKKSLRFSDSTLTRIASISKSMTAIAVMQLVEKGLINLDETIKAYLPDFPTKEKGEITIRQLLSHTSGVAHYKNRKEIENSTHYPSLQKVLKVFEDRPLLFEPGTQYTYTNYGYVILGRIIETVSGLSFEEYMQRNIWDVAEMKNTGIENYESEYQNKSCLYIKGKRKTKQAKQNDLSNRIPGGGVYSTLNDLIKFGQAVLDGKLLADSTLNAMLQTQEVEYEGNKYGLGWRLYGPKDYEYYVYGHDGSQTGCTSQLFIVPATKTIVVVLSNTSRTYRDIVSLASDLVRISETER